MARNWCAVTIFINALKIPALYGTGMFLKVKKKALNCSAKKCIYMNMNNIF